MIRLSLLTLVLFATYSCKTQKNEIYTYSTPLNEDAQNAKISYTISTAEPHTHYAEVSLTVSNYTKEYIDFKLPVWAPGSYLIREFPRFVEDFKASYSRSDLKSEKITKNTWRVYTNNQSSVTVSYKVYCNELSVRTSFVDDSHAYFNGTSVFMYVDELKQKEGTIKIIPHSNFKKIATSLKSKGKNTFSFINYDYLVDAPIEIGNHEEFEFKAGGTKHRVAIYGKGNYNIDTLKRDMAKVCQSATDIFGENPNKEYLFIVHNLTVGSGGLEHINSTTLQVNRNTYEGGKYKGFLNLVAHEYFHLWNVKRIRPEALGPFDYEKENYTHLLWVMEGFTSYYQELILYRAGIYSKEDLVNKMRSKISYIENSVGNKVQSVTESSFDAWIKAYRPHENSANTTISYYSKGATLALMLEFEIINNTKGEKCLDDVMKYLYEEYAKKKKRGFTDKEFQDAVELIAGKKLDNFFQEKVFKPGEVDYKTRFNYVGYDFNKETVVKEDASLGARFSGNRITSLRRGGNAYDGGLNVNDYVLTIDGKKVKDLSKALSKKKAGDMVEITVSRDNIERTLNFKLAETTSEKYTITEKTDLSTTQKENKTKWLTK